MAFGMMEGQKWLLIWVTAFVLLLLIAAIILGKIRKTSTLVTTAVIIGGGVGNLIDRVYRGMSSTISTWKSSTSRSSTSPTSASPAGRRCCW